MTGLETSATHKILEENGMERNNNRASFITTEYSKEKLELGKSSFNCSLKRKPSLKKAATQWLLHTSPKNAVEQSSSQEITTRTKSTKRSFRKRSQSSQYQVDIKSECYEKRPLNARRMAICDEIERRVMISGESLRVLRRNMIVYDNLHKWNLL